MPAGVSGAKVGTPNDTPPRAYSRCYSRASCAAPLRLASNRSP